MLFAKQDIYDRWARNTAYKLILSATALVILGMIIFGFNDLIIFPADYAHQFILVRIYLCTFFVLLATSVLCLQKYSPVLVASFCDKLLFIPALICNATYVYFLSLSTDSPEVQKHVLLGTVTVILVTYQAMAKYYKHAFAWVLLTAYFTYLMDSIAPLDNVLNALISAHIAGLIFAFGFNRHIRTELFDKFNDFKRVHPIRVALELATSNKKMDEIEETKLQERFTAFLVCDWRSFQTLSGSLSPKQLSELFKNFYDIAFSELAFIEPDMTYFTSWTADEHRVTFYSNNKSDCEIRESAVKYAYFLQEKLPQIVRSRLKMNLEFDVGISCGRAMTGLQGPDDNAQYTVFGNHPGVAKRLESEAAHYRKTIKHAVPGEELAPIIIVTTEFEPTLQRLGRLARFEPAKSESSDTKGLPILIDLGGISAERRNFLLPARAKVLKLQVIKNSPEAPLDDEGAEVSSFGPGRSL